MIVTFPCWLDSDPNITEKIDESSLYREGFNFYDKDGFELCIAEQAYYRHNKIELDPCLNHMCCQQKWLEIGQPSIFLDHAIILHRFKYEEEAKSQLLKMQKTIPQAGWLLQTKQKWGFDIAIDSCSDYDIMYEVLHIEYDSYNFDQFLEKKEYTHEQIVRTDWRQAALQIWAHKDEWIHLKGFQQNHWKAKYLFNWNLAEYTEKSV